MYITLNLKTDISLLCVVKVLHDYYRDNTCKKLIVEPTPDTKTTLKNYGLICKPFQEGIKIFFNGERGRKMMERMPPYKLAFTIRINDPKFINYTNLPFIDNSTIWHFSNLYASETADGKKYLHKEDSVKFSKYTNPLRVGRSIEYSFDNNVYPKEVSVKNIIGKVVKLESLEELKEESQTKRRQYPLNYRYKPVDRYKLYHKRSVISDFYVLDEGMGDAWGMIDLYFDKKIKDSLELVGKKGINMQEYTIQFQRRKTFWRYFILQDEGQAYQPQTITAKGNPKKINFSLPKEVQLKSGRTAYMMVSPVPISLQEIPEYKVKMTIRKNGRSTPRTLRLPVPTIDTIKPEKQPNGDIKTYSDIYFML